MIREAVVMARLRTEACLFNGPPRDKIATLEAKHEVDLSHLYGDI
jgi:hypothetical protein